MTESAPGRRLSNQLGWKLLWVRSETQGTDKAWFLEHPEEVDGIGLSASEGWDGAEVAAFSKWGLRALFVPDATRINLRAVRSFDSLRALRFASGAQPVDLRRLSSLEFLHAVWTSKSRLPEDPSRLGVCTLWNLRPKDGTLKVFADATALRHLELIGGEVRSLAGLPPQIEELELHGFRNLWSLDGAPQGLRRLRLFGCSGLAGLRRLRAVSALEELVLSDCGDIESLRPLADLESLQRVVMTGSSRVVDGDLHPLLGKEQTLLKDRPHYNLTADELRRSVQAPSTATS